jgi:hypothetical protein
MKNNLNEQTSRIKQMMGLLKEATTTPDEKIAYDFYSGAYGPGSNLYGMGEALKKITSTAQFAIVNASVKKQSGKLDIAGIINDECEGDDTKSIKAFIAILAKIGITASATFTKEGGYYTPFTFKIATPAVPAASTLATNGWWDKFPSLVAFKDDKTKTKVIHYPKVEQASNGYIYFELTKTPGTYWAFLPTSWVQFDGFENVANPEHKGTWKDENGVLKIIASDGTSFDTASGEWTKAKPKVQWVKNNGFPLKFGQMTEKYPNGIIGKFQVALNSGLNGDGYFGPTTENKVKVKFPEYKRETGVTEAMYNTIVSNTAVSKDLKTTYDMNTQAGKEAYLQQGLKLKDTTASNIAAKYSGITPQQQANADALKSGQPLPKQ